MERTPLGVIEGFYGTPWSLDQRAECIDVIARHGGNTYVWAPKSAPRHRDAWDQPFTDDEIQGFAALAARSPEVAVSVGLTPGSDATIDAVVEKLRPALDAGCRGVTLCFDDLPELAAAAAHRNLAHGVADRTGADVWVVPTHYAGSSASAYLTALVDGLHDDILVMWTGMNVVNDTITADEARWRAGATGGRAPLLWDNTPVNDAVMTSLVHLGPYVGRPDGLRDELSGLLLNPMTSMRGSLPTITSALAWWNGHGPLATWEETIDELGLRHLAEATAFPGDPHWPGHDVSRTWLEAVAALPDPPDDLRPWADAARQGAQIALAGLDAIDALAAGAAPTSVSRQFLQMTALDRWLRAPVRTLGSGPRTRPLWTQDGNGRFTPSAGSIDMTRSIPEHLVARADEALRRHAQVLSPPHGATHRTTRPDTDS